MTQTIHSGLKHSMRLAAIAGIVAFLSFPAGPGRASGYGAMRWLDTLISYAQAGPPAAEPALRTD